LNVKIVNLEKEVSESKEYGHEWEIKYHKCNKQLEEAYEKIEKK